MTISSRLGAGTTVILYLPCYEQRAGRGAGAGSIRHAGLAGGIETVLVVEDDPLVRGYVLIECADGKTDLMALRRGEEVDLLFSDIFLSDNMDGIILAQEERRLRPHLKVLLTSGNASGSAGAASRLAGHHVLAKP